MNNSIIKSFIGFAVIITFFSCKKYLVIDQPVDQLTRTTVFNDPKTIAAAVNGLYGQSFSSSFFNYATEFYPGMFADEFYFNYPFYDVFKNNAYTEQSMLLPALWSNGYSVIYQSNDLIGSLAGTKVISADLRASYIGEAKFFRGFAHFMLSNLYGDVPLILSIDAITTALQPRTSKDSVTQQVISDLKDAESALNSSANPITKVTSAAATAMLARVYLYRKDWGNAEARATQVIGSPKFTLEQDISRVFLRTSPESIFKISEDAASSFYVDYTLIGGFYIPYGQTPSTIVDSNLVNAFEPGDLRKQNWIKSFTGTAPYFPYKYKQNYTPPTPDLAEDYVILRLAEQYLIRAEARARQNNIQDAVDDLNVIRTRAGLGPVPYSISQADLLLATEQERRIELFAEWGHRWFDLGRTGRADAVLGAKKPGWKHTSILLPIPAQELQNNPWLVQNEGYGQ
ncbi:RagB/SusD family nutrient uptake outer membrane protein [Flavitalea flava]